MARRVLDVLIGDVWLASGQSNMEWKISNGIVDMEEEIADASFPGIRFFNVPKRQSDVPETDVRGACWQVASPQTIRDCSAVAWFFARGVFRETGIPIGIVEQRGRRHAGRGLDEYRRDATVSQSQAADAR